jgi:hypothetical protein
MTTLFTEILTPEIYTKRASFSMTAKQNDPTRTSRNQTGKSFLYPDFTNRPDQKPKA